MGLSSNLSRVKSSLNPRRRHYRSLQKAGKPISHTLPTGQTFSVIPEGQIAELLYVMNFEFDLLSLVDTYLQPGMNVVDAGANCGIYSVVAGKRILPDGRIWAFEPGQDSALRLKANMAVNGLKGVYTVEQMALSDVADATMDYVNDKGNGDAYRYLADPKARGAAGVEIGEHEQVRVTSLDAYLKKAGSPKVDFLKIDVEGGEVGVLRGATDTLAGNADIVVLFESSPVGLERVGHTQAELHELVRSQGFQLRVWDEGAGKWLSGEGDLVRLGNVWAVRDTKRLPSY